MCIVCFLSNHYQQKLRYHAQLRTDRFEMTLEYYKDQFCLGLKEELKSNLCSDHENDYNRKILEELNSIDIASIRTFFDELINIYLEWINSNFKLDKMMDIIKELQKDSIKQTINDIPLFRGRESKYYISHWDMFHIPFNKRNMIGNQRYSLVGQPNLYLGYSPLVIFKELNSNISDLYISSFILKNGESLEVYDNRNVFNKIFYFNSMNSIQVEEMFKTKETINTIVSNSNQDILRIDFLEALKKHILYSICSFRKRQELEGSRFVEEYVLPQMLTSALKILGYQGIIFSSTRGNILDIYPKDYVKFNDLLFSNVVIFTAYNKDMRLETSYVYDRELYNKFHISRPVSDILPLIDEIEDVVQKSLIFNYKYLNQIERNKLYKNIDYSLEALKQISSNLKLDSETADSINKYSLELHKFLLQNIILNSEIFSLEREGV